MNKISTFIGLGVLIFVVLACGLVDRFTGLGNMNKVGELWPDVPRMEGFEQSDAEMPTTIKLLLRTIIDNLGRFNKEGEDKTTGDIDWLVFKTAKTPGDIQNFYTNERMTSFGGWEASKNSTCLNGADKGVTGVFCVFAKKKSETENTGLVIVVAQDEKKQQTNVFFVRVETKNNGQPKN